MGHVISTAGESLADEDDDEACVVTFTVPDADGGAAAADGSRATAALPAGSRRMSLGGFEFTEAPPIADADDGDAGPGADDDDAAADEEEEEEEDDDDGIALMTDEAVEPIVP